MTKIQKWSPKVMLCPQNDVPKRKIYILVHLHYIFAHVERFSVSMVCSLNRPHWADSVIESLCPSVCVSVFLSVCLSKYKTLSYGGCGDLWSKGVSLILACKDTSLGILSQHLIFLSLMILARGWMIITWVINWISNKAVYRTASATMQRVHQS